jgi:hypothetical protein
MKKRMRSIGILLFGLVFCLAGCQKEKEAPVVEETPEIIVEEVVESETVMEEQEEEVPLGIHIDTYHKTYYFENGEDAYLYLRYCDVNVEGDEYAKLKRNLENWSMERSEDLRSLYASFEESAKAASEENEAFHEYSLYQSVTIARADEAVVSLLDDTYQHTGGNDTLFYRDGINFDSVSGKRLKLADLFYDYAAFAEDAKERIVYELTEKYEEELFDNYITFVEELWMDEAEPEWYMDGSSIVIILQENTVGPQTIGSVEIHLPYAEFSAYMKEEYFPGTFKGVASFKRNQEIFLTLPGIAEEVPMMLVSELQEEKMYQSLWLGQNELPLEEHLMLEDAFIVRTEKDVYCLLEADMGSDDYVTYVYRVTNGVLEKVNEVYAAIDAANINPHEIKMESWVFLLGTYGGVKNYHFDENGKFITEDSEYILQRNEFVLTTTADLPVVIDDAESVLLAGSHIILNATDGETYVKFTIQETGQSGMLDVTKEEGNYYFTIHGMNESDCFEILPYAG